MKWNMEPNETDSNLIQDLTEVHITTDTEHMLPLLSDIYKIINPYSQHYIYIVVQE